MIAKTTRQAQDALKRVFCACQGNYLLRDNLVRAQEICLRALERRQGFILFFSGEEWDTIRALGDMF
jgi:hypothetical protein